MSAKVAKKEHFLFGLIGAFIFSLAGGAVWFLLYQAGYLASLSGFVGVFCAILGYRLFARKESVKGVVFSVIISALVIVAAWFLCIAHDIYNAYQGWYESRECYYTLTYPECIESAWLFLTKLEFADGSTYIDAESIRGSYFGDLGLGVLFCVIGAFASVKQAIERINAQKFYENRAKETENTVEETAAAIEAPAEAEAEAAAETEAPAEEATEDGVWVCAKCGAKTTGENCEYCDSPREA